MGQKRAEIKVGLAPAVWIGQSPRDWRMSEGGKPVRVLMATIVLLAALATGACGSDGRKDPIFANTPTGANARRLIRQLPRGLP
ncbi:MAG: hypothetical protein ACE5ED_12110, partial [Rhodothalassiaceae bacterium]